MENPFADLIPQQGQQQVSQQVMNNPFADLIPARQKIEQSVAREAIPENQEGFLKRTGRHGAAILGSFGHSLLNIPHNLSFGKIPAYLPGYDFYEAMGVKKNLADTLIQGGLEFAPYMKAAQLVGKIPAAAKYLSTPFKRAAATNIGAGTASGFVGGGNTLEDKLKGAAIGGGIGAGTTLAGNFIIEPAIKYGAEKIAQSTIPGMIKRATEFVKGTKSPEEGAALLKGKYENQRERTSQLYKLLEGEASQLDRKVLSGKREWGHTPKNEKQLAEQLGNSKSILRAGGLKDKQVDEYIKSLKEGRVSPDDLLNQFDPKAYLSKLKAEKSKLKNKIGNDAGLKEKYSASMEYLDDWIKNPPKTWMDAIRRQEAVNYAPKNYYAKHKAEDAYLKGIAKTARTALRESAKQSAINAPLSRIGELLEKAPQAKVALEEFHKGIGKSGYTKPQQTLREGFNLPKGEIPDAAIIKNYMPKPDQTGISSFQQLEKVVGNRQEAQEILRQYILNPLLTKGRNNKDLYDIYNKFSPQQREYLFGGKSEKAFLDSIHNVMQKFGESKKKSAGHHLLTSMGIPGIAGFGAALAAGEGYDKALLAGVGTAAAAKGAKELLGKYITPKALDRLVKRAETDKEAGKKLNTLLQSYYVGTRPPMTLELREGRRG